jgi:hypothetical protein
MKNILDLLKKFICTSVLVMFVFTSLSSLSQELNFTTAGATGTSGPNQFQINAAYFNTPLSGQVTLRNGMQEWVVPVTGTYEITAAGASGGFTPSALGGKGRIIKSEIALTAGDVIQILVGQEGGRAHFSTGYAGGGGGGTCIVNKSTGQPLLISGGGGGAAQGDPSASWKNSIQAGVNATDHSLTNGANGTGFNGSWGQNGIGGVNGNAGTSNPLYGGYYGGSAGSGYFGNGISVTFGGYTGTSFQNGGLGGANRTWYGSFTLNIPGGFGGGAGAGIHGNYEANAGGGGGYSGGGGGNTRVGAAGGGGNIVTGTFITSGLNTGNGYASIKASVQLDAIPPNAIAQNITVKLDANGTAIITPAQINNNSTDNSGGTLTYALDQISFDCTNIGIQNTVILTVTDAAGNTDATTANVTILEHFKETLDLRSLGSFEAFTGGGAVTNSGIFRGDVGTDVGILTGFTGKDFNGAIHNNDDLTAQARIDLLKVYIHLNNILETHPGTHAPSFGSGEKLSPGVYAIGAAGSVAGTLTLDGEGDPNAVFIMKFKGAFTAGAGTNINLINGAKAANVYWIAQGALSVGANSVMKGTLFAYPGAITLGVNSSIEGRLLSSSGAVTVGVGGTATMPGSVDIAINPMVSYAPAASVDVLGSLENFSLFSSIGAVANASFSGILGDIGANVGAISGFATSVQVGSFYNGDAVTAQAKIDLDNAYTQLMLIPTTVRNHTPAFGSGEILEPGVYSTPGAGSLAGTITLDGQNNPDAIFILKFKGAFAAAAQSKVILSNGTRRCNVFWISEGASSIGSFSYMRGTVLAHGGAATMGAGGNLEGRLLSTGGAIGFSTGVVYTVIHDVECDSTPDQKTTVKDVLSNGISLFEENLKVYPNPSKGIFNIKLANLNVQTEIYLFDTTGKLIARTSVSKENNSGSPIRIGNYNLSSGIYLVKIITKEETLTKKVIIETSH